MTQLYKGQPTAGAVRTLYTVPAGDRVVLRRVDATNRSGTGVTVTLSLNSSYVVKWMALAAAGVDAASVAWAGWIVLNAGDTISFYVPSGTVDVIVSGSLYTV